MDILFLNMLPAILMFMKIAFFMKNFSIWFKVLFISHVQGKNLLWAVNFKVVLQFICGRLDDYAYNSGSVPDILNDSHNYSLIIESQKSQIQTHVRIRFI